MFRLSGAWRFSGRYRVIVRVPLGPESTVADRFNHGTGRPRRLARGPGPPHLRSGPREEMERMQPNALLSCKAVLYARVSSKEQEREGYSIPAQCKLLRSYARRHDYQIVASSST